MQLTMVKKWNACGSENMNTDLPIFLFDKYKQRYDEIQSIAKDFYAEYVNPQQAKYNMLDIVSKYAESNELKLEILQYDFKDDELWAFTFLKQGIMFVCINDGLELGKKNFAIAHELYHIYCYVENPAESCIRNGSVLKKDESNNIEDLEANAFAGLILAPDNLIRQYKKKNVGIDMITHMMDDFVMPYKAVILRLYENNMLDSYELHKFIGSHNYVNCIDSESMKIVKKDIWGSLPSNYIEAVSREYVTKNRAKEDKKNINKIILPIGGDAI